MREAPRRISGGTTAKRRDNADAAFCRNPMGTGRFRRIAASLRLAVE